MNCARVQRLREECSGQATSERANNTRDKFQRHPSNADCIDEQETSGVLGHIVAAAITTEFLALPASYVKISDRDSGARLRASALTQEY